MTNDNNFKSTKFLLSEIENFYKAYGLKVEDFPIDVTLLKVISDRYWKDVYRLKQFHNELDLIDCHKIGGYYTYWICKLKPISVSKYQLYVNNFLKTILINELFAVYLAIGRINSNNLDNGISINIKPSSIFIENFTYTLKYRPTTGDDLALIYYLLETNFKNDAFEE